MPHITFNNRVDHDYDSSSTDSESTARSRRLSLLRVSSNHSRPSAYPNFLFPLNGRSSVSSSLASTPIPSRSNSPLPQFYQSNNSSSCTSDTDSEHESSPFLRSAVGPWWREDTQRRWWTLHPRRRKRPRSFVRWVKRWTRRTVRHPCFPQQPITIVLTLILLSAFTISLVLLLMYILNPDKEPLPWRAYCSIPSMASPPDQQQSGFLPSSYSDQEKTFPIFPPDDLDTLPPVGMFIGVFSVDSAFERRSLIRTSWASHPRSRDGAGDGDDGEGTSRTIVRFILGQPRKDYERRIQLEMEMYNDIVILPMSENMNRGKTHTFFSWASINAWVPPPSINSSIPPPSYSYSNYTASPPPLASHDPLSAWHDLATAHPRPWVRPDYVVKADDDAFVMLAELESRLRVELHKKPQKHHHPNPAMPYTFFAWNDPNVVDDSAAGPIRQTPKWTETANDPLIYWGYLVTNRLHRFMAGELYALSWSLVDWVAKDPTVKGLTRGAEDKQTAQWMKIHPRASEIRWASERCWIYDHPRGGTVYGHGFLFPSEAARVRENLSYPSLAPPEDYSSVSSTSASESVTTPTPAAWAHSSVSTFGVRYTSPLPDLSPLHSVEALVEGSNMSMLSEENPMTPEYAWIHREGRRKRYGGKRVGGTIVVHFIKQNMWFLETAIAFLEGEELSEVERYQRDEEARNEGVHHTHLPSSTQHSRIISQRTVQVH